MNNPCSPPELTDGHHVWLQLPESAMHNSRSSGCIAMHANQKIKSGYIQTMNFCKSSATARSEFINSIYLYQKG